MNIFPMDISLTISHVHINAGLEAKRFLVHSRFYCREFYTCHINARLTRTILDYRKICFYRNTTSNMPKKVKDNSDYIDNFTGIS